MARTRTKPIDCDPSWRVTPIAKLGLDPADLAVLIDSNIRTAGDLTDWLHEDMKAVDRITSHLDRFRSRLSNAQIHDFDGWNDPQPDQNPRDLPGQMTLFHEEDQHGSG